METGSTNAKSLTGVWTGLYTYPEGLGSVAFTATLLEFGGDLSGSTHEPDVWGDSRRGELFATLSGFREGRTVSFNKQYDGDGWDHEVAYLGELSADGDEIEGEWSVPEWSGRFLMIRDGRALTAERRSRFEGVANLP